jgi:hypothetical protein
MENARLFRTSMMGQEMAFIDGMRRSTLPLTCHCFIIALVSIYDMYLTVKYAQYLKYMEQNPVGRWLMQLDQLKNGAIPDLTLFLSAKSIGTLIVLTILALLYHHRRRIGHPVAAGVTTFQVVLAWYLTVATTQS